MTWSVIDTITANIFTYYWDVPDTTSTKAVFRITDANGLTGQSGIFSIEPYSSLIVVHPESGEVIAEGLQNYQITWTGILLDPHKTIYLSLDSGQTWSSIGTISSDVFTL